MPADSVLVTSLGGPVPIGVLARIAAFFGFEQVLSIGEGATILIDGAAAFRGVMFGPTIVYVTPSPFSGGRSFEESPLFTNPAGVAKSPPHQTGFYANPLIRGDGALLTFTRSGFLDWPRFDTVNGGSVSATHRSFDTTYDVGAGCTVTDLKGLQVQNPTGAGSVGTQVGVDVFPLTKAATAIGVRNASTYVATPSAQTIDAAADVIAPSAHCIELTNPTGGAITVTAAPTIPDGQNGQEIELLNVGVQNIVLQDQGTLANSNLRLTAASVTLTPRDSMRLRYSTAVGDWVQTGAVVAVL